MALNPRQFAPVAAPPPPKPPQLNLVASALMPDVGTDTLGPGAGPALAAAGWGASVAAEVDEYGQATGRSRPSWVRPAGDVLYRDLIEYHNSLVAAVGVMSEDEYKRSWRRAQHRRHALTAAVGVMSDLEMQQAEVAAGVTVDSLPESVYPSTAARWTGGFKYAPENQYPGVLADPCGQTIDLPAVPAPVLAGANTACGAAGLASASYDYEVTTVNANGETVASNLVTVAVTHGAAVLTWTQAGSSGAGGGSHAAASWNVYGRTHSATLHLLANVPNTGSASMTYCDDGSATPGSQTAPVSNGTGGPGNYGNLPNVAFVPFLIQVEDECSTFGWEARDFTGRALRLLDSATPNAIEREFWTGAFAQNTFTGPMAGSNAFLQQSATSGNGGTGVEAADLTPGSSGGGGTPVSITRGIQILEDYLANSGFGGQGMLHVAPETSPNLLGARRVGALLLTVMDNIVVPGSGYPTAPGASTGPIGNSSANPGSGNAWIFCSDLVSVRLDRPVVIPSTMAEAVDRGAGGAPNTVRIRAERFAAATFDVARLAAVRVTLST
jgi:hypothetical protein